MKFNRRVQVVMSEEVSARFYAHLQKLGYGHTASGLAALFIERGLNNEDTVNPEQSVESDCIPSPGPEDGIAQEKGKKAGLLLAQFLQNGERPARECQEFLRQHGFDIEAWFHVRKHARVKSVQRDRQWWWSIKSQPVAEAQGVSH